MNLIDWEGAYGFKLDEATLAPLAGLSTCVAVGEYSHSAIIRANTLIAKWLPGAQFATIPNAAHFMITTHPAEVAALIRKQLSQV